MLTKSSRTTRTQTKLRTMRPRKVSPTRRRPLLRVEPVRRVLSDRFGELAKTPTGTCSKTGSGKRFLTATRREPMADELHPVADEIEIERVLEVADQVTVGVEMIVREPIDHRPSSVRGLLIVWLLLRTGPFLRIALVSLGHKPKTGPVPRIGQRQPLHVTDLRKVPVIALDHRAAVIEDGRINREKNVLAQKRGQLLLRRERPPHRQCNRFRLMTSV